MWLRLQTKNMTQNAPTAFGTAIGTGTINGNMDCDAPWVAVDLSAFSLFSLSERVVSRENAHLVANTPSINKETQIVG